MFKVSWIVAGISAALLIPRAVEASQCSPVTRENVVSCAVRASLDRRAAEAGVRAAEGRIRVEDPWLAAPPALELTGARREASGRSAFNWSARLGIELEVAGQRGARHDAAIEERRAQASSLLAQSRTTAVDALRLYFEVLAAKSTSDLLRRLEAASRSVWEAARAAAERGVASGVEGDVAEAAYLGIHRRRLEAVRDDQIASASLAALLGRSPDERIDVAGDLDPLASAGGVRGEVKVPDPPEVAALEAERRASVSRASAFRRARWPNPTLSAFVQRDGFDENVIGVGIALPLPLPEPIGRMHSGEIAENEAVAERASFLAAQARRQARLELSRAVLAYATAVEVSNAFTVDRVSRADKALTDLAAEVAGGRVAVRDAVVLQAPLLELLLEAIEARKQLCFASIEVVRAAGLPLGGSQ